ncbi:MAG: metabolite traffic protein EboE [Jatrophihabitantaceae bacterium]
MPAYCTNVHPAEDLPGLLSQLDRYAVPVRERLAVEELPLGLWLPAPVAAGLAADRPARLRLRAELTARGLTVQTLNAFPYGGFHDQVVKGAVYRPDWADLRRLRYTTSCATVLADLLAEDAEYGSISTLPLGWRRPWTDHHDVLAVAALAAVGSALARLDRPVLLAVEPEPGCRLDTVADAVEWLAGRVDPDRIGICLDTCHLAVSFAEPAAELARIRQAGLRVVKVQAAAALHVERPADPASRAALAAYAEPRYLHQVRELSTDGRVLATDDLPDALAELPAVGPWRVHFHLPVHRESLEAPVRPTSEVLRATLAALPGEPGGLPHIEVETYTWSVLPAPPTDAELVAGIAAELAWVAAALTGQPADPPVGVG